MESTILSQPGLKSVPKDVISRFSNPDQTKRQDPYSHRNMGPVLHRSRCLVSEIVALIPSVGKKEHMTAAALRKEIPIPLPN